MPPLSAVGIPGRQAGEDVNHQFNELNWVSTPGACISEPSERETERTDRLRENYPELATWGDAALNEAWGWYSEDCWLVSMKEVEVRDPWFLGYLLQVERGNAIGRWGGNTALAQQGATELGI